MRRSEPRTWVFDVDGCIVDSLTGRSLRPGVRELLSQMRAHGDRLLLWSAGGAEYARGRAVEHGIVDLFDGFHGKDQRDGHGRYEVSALGTPLRSLLFVDDQPGELPIGSDFVAVSPYIAANAHDRGIRPVAERAEAERDAPTESHTGCAAT